MAIAGKFLIQVASPPELERAPLKPDSQALDLAYAYLQDCLADLRRHEAVAWEGRDPEGVHQMRVATRRIRSTLRAFRKTLPPRRVHAFSREFKWLGAALGRVRDLDVYQERMEPHAARLTPAEVVDLNPYRQHLAQQWRKAQQGLLKTLDSRRYARLCERFEGWLKRGPSASARRQNATITIRLMAGRQISRQLERFVKGGDRLNRSSPAASFHAVRIQGKRLRYQLEMFADVFPDQLKSSIKACRRIQEALGNHQDACLSCERLRRYADGVPMRVANRGMLLVLGQLIHWQTGSGTRERNCFLKSWKTWKQRLLNKKLKKLCSERAARTRSKPPARRPSAARTVQPLRVLPAPPSDPPADSSVSNAA